MVGQSKTGKQTGKRGTNPASLANLAKGRKSGGRKPLPEGLKELALNASPAAMRAVIAIASDEDARPCDRLKACDMILDRAYGRPTQYIEGEMTQQVITILPPPKP